MKVDPPTPEEQEYLNLFPELNVQEREQVLIDYRAWKQRENSKNPNSPS